VPGAVLLGLQCPAQARVGKSSPDLLAAVTVHDTDIVRLEGVGAIEHVREQWPACQRLQDLGQCGTHPRALPRGKDDDTQAQQLHSLCVPNSGGPMIP
jgi:hypothetical protein